MVDFGLTILCGFLGGLALHRLKVPGGMMLGSVIAVAFLNIQTSHVFMPGAFRTIAQIIAGAYIGMSVDKKDVGRIRELLKPTLFLLMSLFLTNLVIGYLMYLVSPMDLLTALLAAVPGGISDTPLIAADMGADVAKVTVLQFMRLIAGIGLIPVIVKLIDARAVKDEGKTVSLDMKIS
ncbi:MAG TPA: AbrB family transcriptional regulator, partial [Clostridiaceae bacterium]|nr:AbrB family transcriptional regulator [Clostridiaceae bacterium]